MILAPLLDLDNSSACVEEIHRINQVTYSAENSPVVTREIANRFGVELHVCLLLSGMFRVMTRDGPHMSSTGEVHVKMALVWNFGEVSNARVMQVVLPDHSFASTSRRTTDAFHVAIISQLTHHPEPHRLIPPRPRIDTPPANLQSDWFWHLISTSSRHPIICDTSLRSRQLHRDS
jgi:hypothetical protein